MPDDFDDLFDDLDPERAAAAKQVEEWSSTGRAPRGRGRPAISRARRARIEAQTAAMMKTKQWDGAEPNHLVALYAYCHSKVYGVACGELDGEAWVQATQAAKRLVAEQLRGDLLEAVEFIRWTWTRETATEKWRRSQPRDADRTYRRIGWRLQFDGKSLFTDWCVDMARRQG